MLSQQANKIRALAFASSLGPSGRLPVIQGQGGYNLVSPGIGSAAPLTTPDVTASSTSSEGNDLDATMDALASANIGHGMDAMDRLNTSLKVHEDSQAKFTIMVTDWPKNDEGAEIPVKDWKLPLHAKAFQQFQRFLDVELIQTVKDNMDFVNSSSTAQLKSHVGNVLGAFKLLVKGVDHLLNSNLYAAKFAPAPVDVESGNAKTTTTVQETDLLVSALEQLTTAKFGENTGKISLIYEALCELDKSHRMKVNSTTLGSSHVLSTYLSCIGQNLCEVFLDTKQVASRYDIGMLLVGRPTLNNLINIMISNPVMGEPEEEENTALDTFLSAVKGASTTTSSAKAQARVKLKDVTLVEIAIALEKYVTVMLHAVPALGTVLYHFVCRLKQTANSVSLETSINLIGAVITYIGSVIIPGNYEDKLTIANPLCNTVLAWLQSVRGNRSFPHECSLLKATESYLAEAAARKAANAATAAVQAASKKPAAKGKSYSQLSSALKYPEKVFCTDVQGTKIKYCMRYYLSPKGKKVSTTDLCTFGTVSKAITDKNNKVWQCQGCTSTTGTFRIHTAK